VHGVDINHEQGMTRKRQQSDSYSTVSIL